MKMQDLNLPTYSFKIKSFNNLDYIYDNFRRKYVRLTPEEWVRQNFANYLVKEKAFSSSRLVIEQSLKVYNLAKRCDILAYNDYGQSLLIVECKSPSTEVSQETLNQVAIYNITLRVPYLVITNGLKHYCLKMEYATRRSEYLPEIPDYESIRSLYQD